MDFQDVNQTRVLYWQAAEPDLTNDIASFNAIVEFEDTAASIVRNGESRSSRSVNPKSKWRFSPQCHVDVAIYRSREDTEVKYDVLKLLRKSLDAGAQVFVCGLIRFDPTLDPIEISS